MKIIIPLAGKGERFAKVGYRQPKALIKVHDKPMIAHVVEMFSKNDEFIFICNSADVKKFPIRKTLSAIAPRSKIVEINYRKLGPVWGVTQALRRNPNL